MNSQTQTDEHANSEYTPHTPAKQSTIPTVHHPCQPSPRTKVNAVNYVHGLSLKEKREVMLDDTRGISLAQQNEIGFISSSNPPLTMSR
jgi:hypothetical protein